jgi:hypothetical protein
MDFISGVIWTASIMVVLWALSRNKKYDKEQDPRMLFDNERLAIVRAAFMPDGCFVEDVMVSCLRNRNANRFFQDYHKLNLKERRNLFCELCLQAASDNKGIIEAAYLSQEFASMWRVAIGFLPKECQHFYKTTRPVFTFNPHDTLIETDDFLDWTVLHLPEYGKQREQRIKRLVQAFAVGKIIIRFKRNNFFLEVPFSPAPEVQGEKN